MDKLAIGVSAFVVMLTSVGNTYACPWCRVQVNNGVYDQDFLTNLVTLLLPLFLLAGLGIGLYNADKVVDKFKGGVK